jgi:hypothetical protein
MQDIRSMDVVEDELSQASGSSPHLPVEGEVPQAPAQLPTPLDLPHASAPPTLPAMHMTVQEQQQLQNQVAEQAKELAALRSQLLALQQQPPQSVSWRNTPHLPLLTRLMSALQTQQSTTDSESTSGLTSSVGTLNLTAMSNPVPRSDSAGPRHYRRNRKGRSTTPPARSGPASSSTASQQLVRLPPSSGRFHPYAVQTQQVGFWKLPTASQPRRKNRQAALDPLTQSMALDSAQKQLGMLGALERKTKRIVQAQLASNQSDFQLRLDRATKSTERYLKALEEELKDLHLSQKKYEALAQEQTDKINSTQREVHTLTNERPRSASIKQAMIPPMEEALAEAQAKLAKRTADLDDCKKDIAEATERFNRLQQGDPQAVEEVEMIRQKLSESNQQAQPEASTSSSAQQA